MSTYLKRSILLVVASLAISHASTASAYDTTIFDRVQVDGIDNPFDVGNGGMFDSGGTDAPGTSGSSSEGGGGDASPPESCAWLRASKPAHCHDPVAYPVGHAFANDKLPGGSGVPKLVYFADRVSGISPTARITIHTALSRHTSELAGAFVPLSEANGALLDSVSRACTDQRSHDTPVRNGLGLKATYQERKCLESLEKLTAEASGNGFSAWFIDWFARNGLVLSDLGIPQTIIGLFNPANSLFMKNAIAGQEGRCATWWHNAKQSKCAG